MFPFLHLHLHYHHYHRHHIIHNLIKFLSHPKINKFPLIMSSKLTLASLTQFNYFVKRLKQMNQDLVCLDSVSGKLSIYSGGTTLIHSIDPTRLFQSMPTTPLGFRTIGLSNSS